MQKNLTWSICKTVQMLPPKREKQLCKFAASLGKLTALSLYLLLLIPGKHIHKQAKRDRRKSISKAPLCRWGDSSSSYRSAIAAIFSICQSLISRPWPAALARWAAVVWLFFSLPSGTHQLSIHCAVLDFLTQHCSEVLPISCRQPKK